VRARSANNMADLATASWTRIENGATIPRNGPNSLPGSLIQVEVKLIANRDGVSPIVYDVTIAPRPR
jgi:hypothetical protein